MSYCQTLGDRRNSANRETQRHLLWVVYRFESGPSLQLGRAPGIYDADIILPIDTDEPHSIKSARIPGKNFQSAL